MKRYISDNELYRDLSMAVYDVIAAYVGDSAADATVHSNADFINRLDMLTDSCGYAIRYFKFREALKDVDGLTDDDIYDKFLASEAEREAE